MGKFLFLLASLILPFGFCHSQSDSFGVFGGVDYNIHSGNFQKLPGFPNCCPSFENGEGWGYHLGIEYLRQLFPNYEFSPRIGFVTFSGKFRRPERTVFIIDGKPNDGEFEHRLDANFQSLILEPMMKVRPLSFLTFSAGMNFSYLLKYRFHQEEAITKPSDRATFLDSNGNDTHSRLRNVFDGDIPNINQLQLFFASRIGLEIPLSRNGRFTISPEMSFYIPLQKIGKNLDWKVTTIASGLALRYYPQKSLEKPRFEEKLFKIDTVYVQVKEQQQNAFKRGREELKEISFETDSAFVIQVLIFRTDTIFVIPPKSLKASLELFAVDSAGNFVQNPKIRVEEYVATKMEPLLNYIFFDEGSDQIPNRYVKLNKTDLSHFSLDSLYRRTTLDVYYNILNIIGKRLDDNKSAKISLVGYNSGIGVEENNLELSKRRAENVRNYLVETWGISPNRIQIEYKNLPEKSSTPIDDTLKSQENRRVEIISTDWEILQPVTIRTIERKTNVDRIGYRAQIVADTRIAKTELKIFLGEDTSMLIHSYQGTDTNLVNTFGINDILQKNTLENFKIFGLLEAQDIFGNFVLAKDSITNLDYVSFVKQKERIEGEYQIDYYRLILFDFDKWNIEGGNRWIVNYIKSRIPLNATVEIYGATDITGDDLYNKNLSQKRADAVRQALGFKNAKSIGLGEEKLEFPNDLPEGRFYSRNVLIVVKKPVK